MKLARLLGGDLGWAGVVGTAAWVVQRLNRQLYLAERELRAPLEEHVGDHLGTRLRPGRERKSHRDGDERAGARRHEGAS